MSDPFPNEGRLAGIDYGTVRVGVALTDPGQRIASPYENYTRCDLGQDAQWFRQFVEEERVVGIVVGLPVHTDGLESQKSLESREYGKWLAEVTSLPVRFYDERFTTVQAEQLLGDAKLTKKKRKARLDMLAAQIMLAAFLESATAGEDAPEALDG